MEPIDFQPLVISGPDDEMIFSKRLEAEFDILALAEERIDPEVEFRRGVTHADHLRFVRLYVARVRRCTTLDELVSVAHHSGNSKGRYLRKHREMLFALECLEDFLACKLTDWPWDPKPEKNEALRWLDSKLTNEAHGSPRVER